MTVFVEDSESRERAIADSSRAASDLPAATRNPGGRIIPRQLSCKREIVTRNTRRSCRRVRPEPTLAKSGARAGDRSMRALKPSAGHLHLRASGSAALGACVAGARAERDRPRTPAGNPQSEWDITGAGDASIQGFATDISVNHGRDRRLQGRHQRDATIASTSIASATTAGIGARKVATIAAVGDAAADPAGLPRPTRRRAWSTAATGRCRRRGPCRPTPSPASTSRSWSATDTTTGASHIVFVVRDDDAALAICCSRRRTRPGRRTTSTAATASTSARPTGRAYKVSYNRPFTTRGTSARGLAASTPSTRWCAGWRRNGYDVSYSPASTPIGAAPSCSSTRSSSRSATTSTGRATARQRRGGARRRRQPRVLQRQRGLLEDALGDQHRRLGTPYRTLVCYKETHANAKIDPDRRRGPAPGAIRASARRPTADGPRTR